MQYLGNTFLTEEQIGKQTSLNLSKLSQASQVEHATKATYSALTKARFYNLQGASSWTKAASDDMMDGYARAKSQVAYLVSTYTEAQLKQMYPSQYVKMASNLAEAEQLIQKFRTWSPVSLESLIGKQVIAGAPVYTGSNLKDATLSRGMIGGNPLSASLASMNTTTKVALASGLALAVIFGVKQFI